jgi:hypothetical protein
MSLAERTREAVRAHPFLQVALRAGVLNHAAAARYLDLGGDPEAVATALRRHGEELDSPRSTERRVTVRMQSGLGLTDDAETALLSVGETAVGGEGAYTAILATGDVDPTALAAALARLAAAGRRAVAAGAGPESLVVVVPKRRGAEALRLVEAALEAGDWPLGSAVDD